MDLKVKFCNVAGTLLQPVSNSTAFLLNQTKGTEWYLEPWILKILQVMGFRKELFILFLKICIYIKYVIQYIYVCMDFVCIYVSAPHVCSAHERFLDPWVTAGVMWVLGPQKKQPGLLSSELSLQLQSFLLDYAQMHITIHLSLSLEFVDLAVLGGQKPPRIHCIPRARIRVLHLVFHISSEHPDSGPHTSLVSTFWPSWLVLCQLGTG